MFKWIRKPKPVLFRVFLCTLLLCFISISSHAKSTLKLCVSDSTWFPFIIVKKDRISGVYIDILIAASDPLDYEIEVDAIPWKRCLQLTKVGRYDGIAGVSYQQSRAKYLSYPEDITAESHSEYQLSQVDYVAVTHIQTKFSYTGDLLQLPPPVRSPLGYSIGKELEALGLEVDNGALSDQANFNKLLDGLMIS